MGSSLPEPALWRREVEKGELKSGGGAIKGKVWKKWMRISSGKSVYISSKVKHVFDT